MTKPIHAKPSLYAYYFYELKEIALRYGYNLVLHGSLNRDLDLVAIPWQEELKPHEAMIQEFAQTLGGKIQIMKWQLEDGKVVSSMYRTTHHGRMQFVIDINRECKSNDNWSDPQYYLDVSVIPFSKISN